LEKGRCVALFPKDLEAPKPYIVRLQEVVAAKFVNREKEVNSDMVHHYLPPSYMVMRYQSMWAYGNHLQLQIAKRHLKTLDCRKVAIF
jgi:hypothetical protein